MSSPQHFSPGALVHSRYRIIDIVGRGGVATVYRAVDEQLGRDVALKVIPHGAVGSADLQRIEEEVRLVASFSHPALVTLYDVVSDDGSDASTLVMQFVGGEDLSVRIARGALAPGAVAEIGASVAAALAFVHASGVIHRDVKPANILLPASGPQPALLADFGIARLVDSAGITATGTIIGTASYLSPEQARGGALTDRSDIYSLGLVLLESLTGVRAFPGSAVESVAARLSADPQIPQALGAAWSELLGRMVDRSPQARPSAAEVQSELGAIVGPTATLLMPVAEAPTERLEPAARTEALAPAAATEAPAPAAATEVLAPVAATELLRPVAPTLPEPGPTPRGSRRGILVIGVLAALLIVIAVVFALTRLEGTPTTAPTEPTESGTAASSPSAPLPPISYPSVDGDLGDRLAALQEAVGGLDEQLARELGQRVLAVSEAAATGDFDTALSSLAALDDAVNAAELSAADRQTITDATEAVRKQLDSLIKDADEPGNGNGKPDKP